MSIAGRSIRAVAAAALIALSLQAQAEPLRLLAGSRLSIDARINGTPVEALLDSGAEVTLIDVEFARKVGLTGGQDVTARGSGKSTQQARLVEGVTLEALGVTLPKQTIAVIDLSDVGRRLLGGRLDVVLGRELFDAVRLVIDVEGKTIRVASSDEKPLGVRLPLQSHRGIEMVPVSIEGGPEVLADFDFGNGSEVLLGVDYVTRMKMLEDGRPVGTAAGGGLGGEQQRKLITVRSLQIAGKTFENLPASVDPEPQGPDANVGVSILRHFIVTTDFRGRAVWLQPRP